MFLTARVLRYVSFPNLSTTSTGGVLGGIGVVGGGVCGCTGLIASWALGGRPRLGCEAKELALEVAFFFFFFPFPFVVDGLPFHSVPDLGVPINLELRNEIGLVTSRKTPAIILPPFRIVRME